MIKKMTSCILINKCRAQPSSEMLPPKGDENKYRNPQPIYIYEENEALWNTYPYM